jgi:hypothetical protein
MKKKILLWSVLLILILGLAAGAFWWLRRPQVITFSDDSKLTLLAVDYGTRHVPPGVKAPTSTNTTTRVRARNGVFNTAAATLVVWVRQERDPQPYANFQYYLYDAAGSACVQSAGMNYVGGNRQQSNMVVGIQFPAFPRRQGKFVLRVEENGNGGQEMADKKFTIRNPAHGPFPDWTAEPLPATKSEDDLSVTLTKLVFGADTPYNRDQDDPDDALNKGVQATFNISQNGKPATNWQPMQVETSDATGNHVNGYCNSQWQGDDDVATYQFGLWSDEPAWKLRFNFVKQSGYSDNETWSVQNIPLEPGRQQDFYNFLNQRNNTNTAFAETDLNGVHLKIFPVKKFTDVPPNAQPQGGIQIQATPPLPAGVEIKIIKLTDDQGQEVQTDGNSTSMNNQSAAYGYQLSDLASITNLNVTIALPKSHFLEFTVKPEKEKP